MKRQGFSLLELSIVLTIIAIVVAGGLTIGTAKTQQIKMIKTHDELLDIEKAIAIYVNNNGCLPYPAVAGAAIGTVNYGREPAANAECATTGGTGLTANVIEGEIPFYSLGLADEYSADEWNTRYTYAVTDTAVESGFSSSFVGAINVLDDGSNVITSNAVYVILSHGKERKGGLTAKTGAATAACDAADKEGDNCNADGTFVDAVFNDGDIPANFFDDIIIWNNIANIYEYTAGGGSGITSPIPSDVKVTSVSSNGNFTDYQTMATWAAANGCAGYKVCTTSDAARYFYENAPLASTAWVGGVADADCSGWTSSAGGNNGATWAATELSVDACSASHPVLCCNW